MGKLPSTEQGWGIYLVLGRDGGNYLVLGRDGEEIPTGGRLVLDPASYPLYADNLKT